MEKEQELTLETFEQMSPEDKELWLQKQPWLINSLLIEQISQRQLELTKVVDQMEINMEVLEEMNAKSAHTAQEAATLSLLVNQLHNTLRQRMFAFGTFIVGQLIFDVLVVIYLMKGF